MPLSPEQNRARNRRRRQSADYLFTERQTHNRRRRERRAARNRSEDEDSDGPPSAQRRRIDEDQVDGRPGRLCEPRNEHGHVPQTPTNPTLREPSFNHLDEIHSQNLWWTRFHDSMARNRWHPPVWNRRCHHCSALLLTGENLSYCCNNGQKIVPALPPLPRNIQQLIESPTTSSRNLSSSSRRLNNLFSFTAIGATQGFNHFSTGSASVAITGRTYHRMLDVTDPNHSFHWFLYDETEREAHGREWEVEIPWTRAVKRDLDEVNPYVHQLRLFERTREDSTTALEIFDTSSNGDFAAVMHAANSTNIRPRSILIWRNSEERPSFVSILTRHYEPLHYPLLFPHGSRGWGLSAPDPSHPENITNMLGFTQREWYKGRLLTDDRFLTFGRLCSEYLCDMYSRIEEEHLGYIRRGRLSRAHQVDPSIDDSSINIELPASFLGSRRWASEETADSLALGREYGKPSYFITMTCNPEWPEIKARLKPGQSASDIPVIVARAFKIRLQRLQNLLRKKLGHLRYMIKVIEFQKRGWPHAHIIIKVC